MQFAATRMLRDPWSASGRAGMTPVFWGVREPGFPGRPGACGYLAISDSSV